MNTQYRNTFVLLLAFFTLLLLACDLSSLVGGATKPTVVITAPPSGADSQYRAVSESETYLEPVNGAMFAIAGTGSGDRSMCTYRLLSTDRIPIKNLQVEAWVCYKTNEGRRAFSRSARNTSVTLESTCWTSL